jgi:hypothetical protein
MATRLEAQHKIRSVWLPPSLYARVEAFAAANALSVSEALREFMRAYAKGKPLAAPQRSTRRVTIWMDPEEYVAFAQRRKDDGVTIAAAVESMMGDDA